MDASWHVCYSGGADGGVYATDLAHRRSAMLFEGGEGRPVAHPRRFRRGKGRLGGDDGMRDRGGDATWTGGTTSTRSRRGRGADPDIASVVVQGLADVGVPETHARAGRRPARTSNAWGARTRGRAPTRSTRPPRRRSSPPRPSSNTFKRQTDCASSPPDADAVSLWDVIKCERVRCFERGTSLASAAKETNPRVSVPSWFTVDTRSGSIAISLMPSGAFQAEAYAVDFGVAEANDELKLNYGVQCVHMLLRDWKARRVRAIACENGRAPDSSDDDLNDSDSNDFDVNSLPRRGREGVGAFPSRPPSLVCEQPEGEGGAVPMPVGEMAGSAEEQDAPRGSSTSSRRGTGAGFGQGFVSPRAARVATRRAEAVAGAGHRAEGPGRAQGGELRGAKAGSGRGGAETWWTSCAAARLAIPRCRRDGGNFLRKAATWSWCVVGSATAAAAGARGAWRQPDGLRRPSSRRRACLMDETSVLLRTSLLGTSPACRLIRGNTMSYLELPP